MSANDLRHDAPEPEPLTPEERYEYHAAMVLEVFRDAAWVMMLSALRDMIASRDVELERQSVAINRLERRIDALERGQR